MPPQTSPTSHAAATFGLVDTVLVDIDEVVAGSVTTRPALADDSINYGSVAAILRYAP